jgi:transposase
LLLFQLLHAPAGSRLVRTDFDGVTLTLGIATTNPIASCPACGGESQRVHSRYTRHLAEEPAFGHQVRLGMSVRRFLCPDLECPRQIFVEPLGGLAARHARTTTRLAQVHLAIGSALGGEAGARLAEKVAMPTSPDTLLRRVKQAGSRSSPSPRLVGIDDWAWCKGQRYGTIVVDLETSEVIDLLPDRDAATVGTWLAAHPGVELVSRDRASAYSQAATEAASQAQQVADRWHLLKNVREAIERLLERHQPLIADAFRPANPDPVGADASPGDEPLAVPEMAPKESSSASIRREVALAKRVRRVERFERVQELRRQGIPIRQIARDLGMSRMAVRRYLRRERCPDWSPGRATRSGMDAHREWIDARIAEGRNNASELHRELASRGVRLSYATVRRYLTKRLGRAGKTRPRVDTARPKPNPKPKPTPPPSPKQLSFDWIRRPEKRTAEAGVRLDKLRAASPDLTIALDLADEFTALIRKRSTGTLKEWLSRAEVSLCPEVRHFAEGIRRDESAVNAAVTLRWSNGPVEGHVNRLKTIKRQMYGRAGFPLLKARVVNAA